jgi:tRNA (cytidine/uridine-2'-O-)-methyltransferase
MSVAEQGTPRQREVPLHIVLVEPEIAANAGSIGRTCVAVGAELWLVRPLGFHIDDCHLRRAGLDYWDHLRWRVVDHLEEVLEALGSERLWAFTSKSRTRYTEVSYHRGDALVFGSESRGLPERWREACRGRTVGIPVRREARCLNLACAVAVGAYEALRQIEIRG